jgi:hypothetical protein
MWVQAQLDAIEGAIAAGVTSVSYEGKTSTFRSLDEMLRVRNIIMRALGLAPSASATVTVSHDRGYGGFGSDAFDTELFTGW